MPKERIRKSGNDGFADLLVQWGPEELGHDDGRRKVRLFVIASELGQPGAFYFYPSLTDEEKAANPDRIGAHDEGIGPVDIMLDRDGCNRLIQMLRRARDKTFGRDEMSKRPPRKSRVPAEKVRVVVQPPANRQDGYAEPPGYSGHNGGSFSEAGYRSGRGQFGFVHETLP